MGDYPAAAAHYAKVKQMGPRDYDALNNVAWFKATCPDGSFRNGKEAVQESTKACELTKWKNGGFVDTLAAAWAEAGDFNQAVKYAEQALATSGLSASSRNEVQNHLRLFRQHKPWREQSKLKKGRS
jgi:Flp pilus assembly protein TadD